MQNREPAAEFVGAEDVLTVGQVPTVTAETGEDFGYWRSLNQLANTPEFRAAAELTDKDYEAAGERALQQGSELNGEPSDGELSGEPLDGPDSAVSRRRFLQVMGASLALAGGAAGMGGCTKTDQVLPFTNASAEHTPGIPKKYASACELAGHAVGVMVTSYDGRPIKIEGNPAHPMSRGAQSMLTVAETLNFYDPDRSRSPAETDPSGRATKRSWDEFLGVAVPLWQSHATADGGSGAKLRILAEASSSPSLGVLRAKFAAKYPNAAWVEYEPLSADNVRQGTALAFSKEPGSSKPMRPHYRFDRAEVVVLLDADPLHAHPAAMAHARDFAVGRKGTDGKMSTVYAVESCYSVSGTMADHRLPLQSSRVAVFAAALAESLSKKLAGVALPWSKAEEVSAKAAFLAEPVVARFLAELAEHLAKKELAGKVLVVAGERQPPAVHAIVAWINQSLGSVGSTLTYTAEPDAERPSHLAGLKSLVADMAAGKVDTLLIVGGNPVYNAPADFKFAEALAKVPHSAHLSFVRDETSQKCKWHLPRSHWLESWGDARGYDGTVSIIQPLIAPLSDQTRSPLELLAALLGVQPSDGFNIVRQTFAAMLAPGQDLETAWRTTLHSGVLLGTGLADSAKTASLVLPSFATVEAKPTVAAKLPLTMPEAGLRTYKTGQPSNGELEVVFLPDSKVFDGRFANNAWLQECPDPLTTLTWDNVALISKSTADSLGVPNGVVARFMLPGREVRCVTYVMPGQAVGTVGLILGYGRTAAGQVGGLVDGPVLGITENQTAAPVGFDVYPLRTSQEFYVADKLEILPPYRPHKLATVQDHHIIDELGADGRAKRVSFLLRESTLSEYKENPHHLEEAYLHPPNRSLWDNFPYDDAKFNSTGRKWGMAIDLSSCTGCNSCVVACQAENNIPVVGKEQVLVHREMHWIRVDRYFAGPVGAPRVLHQPVTCLHCETAPCEQVCPVAATVHNAEGLNVMVYNRCIGTRYCANNCPVKVRRFNWFYQHFRAEKPGGESLKLLNNPSVTVRSRGVMEKCSFCVHRINAASIAAKNGDFRTSGQNHIPDGTIVTACQQACPTGAITFGDLSDRTSRVSKLFTEARRYAMLSDFNIQPRVQYLAKLRHPNPKLEPAKPKSDHHGSHDHTHTDKSHTDKSHTDKSHTDKSHTDKSHTDKSHTDKSHTDKSHTDKSHTPDKSPSDKAH